MSGAPTKLFIANKKNVLQKLKQNALNFRAESLQLQLKGDTKNEENTIKGSVPALEVNEN